LLTEKEMMNSWARLFRGGQFSEGLFKKAEMLLEEIKPESPLRHRLAGDLEELRARHQVAAASAEKSVRAT
jgi:hypothetical protein